MATDNLHAFTIRLPADLIRQVDERAHVHGRSRNAETRLLIETAIDLAVRRDRILLDAIVAQKLKELENNPSP